MFLDKNYRKEYLEENETFYKELDLGICHLNILINKLNNFNINIISKSWYKNFIQIYLIDALEYYNNCKKDDFDICVSNNIWMRSSCKSFLSEVEKFIKFFVKTILNIDNKNINFCYAINKLDFIVQKYKNLFNDKGWELQIENIKNHLHKWRKNYNENKHEDKMDDNIYIEQKKCNILENDILQYMWTFVVQIMNPLLLTMLVIFDNEISNK